MALGKQAIGEKRQQHKLGQSKQLVSRDCESCASMLKSQFLLTDAMYILFDLP
jgi:hypothetical protein